MEKTRHWMAMAHSPIRNYIVPGLTSYLIGEPSPNKGLVRIFHCEREQKEFIIPHSHRFDLYSLVLSGYVENTIFTPGSGGDAWRMSDLSFDGIGNYARFPREDNVRFETYTHSYREGESYSMEASEIHTIRFRKDAYLLIMEGRRKRETSIILEPVNDGKVIQTFSVEPWMFQREPIQEIEGVL